MEPGAGGLVLECSGSARERTIMTGNPARTMRSYLRQLLGDSSEHVVIEVPGLGEVLDVP